MVALLLKKKGNWQQLIFHHLLSVVQYFSEWNYESCSCALPVFLECCSLQVCLHMTVLKGHRDNETKPALCKAIWYNSPAINFILVNLIINVWNVWCNSVQRSSSSWLTTWVPGVWGLEWHALALAHVSGCPAEGATSNVSPNPYPNPSHPSLQLQKKTKSQSTPLFTKNHHMTLKQEWHQSSHKWNVSFMGHIAVTAVAYASRNWSMAMLSGIC